MVYAKDLKSFGLTSMQVRVLSPLPLEDHLKSRGMNTNLYHVCYDENEMIASFFLYNLSGQIVGYQQYRPLSKDKKTNNVKEARYFTYLPRQVNGVFGLEVLNEADKTIYIVEGIFKAAILHRLGFNSIAVLSSTPKQLKPWFRIMKQQYDLIAIGDNDSAGKQLIATVKKGFQSPIDLDEMVDADILALIGKCPTRGLDDARLC